MIGNYYVRRVLHVFIVFLLSLTFTFALYRLLPFGPMEIMRLQLEDQMVQGGSYDQEEIERIDRLVEVYSGINPDRPLYIEYPNYLYEIIFYQDFGQSIFHNRAVWPLMLERMQWSLFISVYGLALGTISGLLLGILMAYYEGGRFDKLLTSFTIFNQTVPYYVVAIFSIIIFTYQFDLLPAGGLKEPGTTPGFNLDFMIGISKHAALPVMSAFVAGFGGALEYRGNCIRELGKGYIRVAHLRGIKDSRIAIRYIGRNSLLPIYTGLLMGISALFGSSIILEIIFNYPAMGQLTFNALLNRDYPLLMGSFILYTILTLTGILIADLTYGIIDPRVKGGREREAF